MLIPFIYLFNVRTFAVNALSFRVLNAHCQGTLLEAITPIKDERFLELYCALFSNWSLFLLFVGAVLASMRYVIHQSKVKMVGKKLTEDIN